MNCLRRYGTRILWRREISPAMFPRLERLSAIPEANISILRRFKDTAIDSFLMLRSAMVTSRRLNRKLRGAQKSTEARCRLTPGDSQENGFGQFLWRLYYSPVRGWVRNASSHRVTNSNRSPSFLS